MENNVFIQDFTELPSSLEIDDDGFVTVTGNVARVGIQEYLGTELGRPNDNNVYKVYRPQSVVEDSVKTFKNKPITINHQGMVSIKNVDKVAKGVVLDCYYDAETGWVKASELINHPDGVKAIMQDGYRWHSCGYKASLKWEKGEYEGQICDAVITAIKGNHIALVKNPRAGEMATFDEGINITVEKNIGDSMTVKYDITLSDGGKLELEGDNAQKIHALIASLQGEKQTLSEQLSDSKSALDKLNQQIQELTDAKKTLEGEVAGLKAIADSKPEKSVTEISEFLETYDSVRHLLGDEKPFDKSPTELKAMAIKAIGKESLLTDNDPKFVNAVFSTLKDGGVFAVTDTQPSPKKVLNQSGNSTADNPLGNAVKSFVSEIENAWKA